MKQIKKILFSVLFIVNNNLVNAQCAGQANIYSFTYNNHAYQVVKEKKTWTDAVNCAVTRGGYLAEINDVAEQDAIFNELTNNAGIVSTNTQNQFGTGSVWLGGTDAGIEGNWVWDGNVDGIETQFWSGASNGNPVGGLYTNWGTSPAEPDNAVGGQDHLTIIIKPTAVNYGLWNDLVSTNTIYYLIEYDQISSIQNVELKSKLNIYPNPFNSFITIENNNSEIIDRVDVVNLLGQSVKTFNSNEIVDNRINLASLSNGVYNLTISFENGEQVSQKIVK